MPDAPPDDYERLLADFHGTVQDLQVEIDRADKAERERANFKRLATKNLNDRLRVAGELDDARLEMAALRGAVRHGEHELRLLQQEVNQLRELVQLKDEAYATTTPTWEPTHRGTGS